MCSTPMPRTASRFHAAAQRQAAAALTELAGGEPVPFLRAVARLAECGAPEAPVTAWQRAALAQLDGRAGEREVELDLSALPAIDQEALAGAPLDQLAGRHAYRARPGRVAAGEFQLVVSEAHDTLMVWGWALAFHPDRGAVEASVEDLFEDLDAGHTLTNVLPSKRVKIIPFEYPGPTIEIDMPTERREERIAVTDVWAHVEGGHPVLRADGVARPITLANGELNSFAHSVFAPPASSRRRSTRGSTRRGSLPATSSSIASAGGSAASNSSRGATRAARSSCSPTSGAPSGGSGYPASATRASPANPSRCWSTVTATY